MTRSHSSLRRTGLLVLASLPLLAAGCDNPACLFTECGAGSGTGGGIGTQPASVPSLGDTILTGAPKIVRSFPEGQTAHPESVVVIEFTESVTFASAAAAFEILPAGFGGVPGLPGGLPYTPSLIGNGRLLILAPLADLDESESYDVLLKEDETVSDLTGVEMARPVGDLVLSFSLMNPVGTTPQIMATFPAAGATGVSDITSIITVFDRKMDDTTVDSDSFSVTIDGIAPGVHPDASALFGPPETRQVYTWQSEVAGVPLSLGAGGAGMLRLSSPGFEILDDMGEALIASTINFSISPAAVPLSVIKSPASAPEDAIGEPNLLDVLPVLSVLLPADAVVGDSITLTLFGESPTTGDQIALARTVVVDADSSMIEFTAAELDLATGVGPLTGRFADGDIQVAASHAGVGFATVVQVLDLDPLINGLQGMYFDLTPPTFIGFGDDGMAMSVVSDMRDLIVTGKANEELRQVDVSVLSGPMGDNGVDPRVVASDSSGFFMAAPVTLGVVNPLDLPLNIEVLIYDRALNPASISTLATYNQIGASGPGVALPAATIDVEVFDATTLLPLPMAFVMSHEVNGAVTTSLEEGTTDAAGHIQLMASAANETVITVDVAGYDLFTFHDVPTDRLQVMLEPSLLGTAMTDVLVVSQGPFVNFSSDTRRLSDTRIPLGGDPLSSTSTCMTDPFMLVECDFDPITITPNRVGAQSFISADLLLTQGGWTAANFLRGFAFRAPSLPLFPAASEDVEISVANLLATSLPEDQAIAHTPALVDMNTVTGLGALVGDPLVSVEGRVPGMTGSLAVGAGVPYDQGGNIWDILSAYAGAADGIPGAMDLLGTLVSGGQIDGDLHLRVEFQDMAGNRTGVRPRFSLTAPTLIPPSIPALISPAPMGNTLGATYDIEFPNVILDAAAQPGLYKVTLTDVTGRRWVLWRPDELDASGNMSVHVPEIALEGGVPLMDGTITCQISGYAWRTMSSVRFLWTDIQREHDLYVHTAPVTYSQP
jgi:hypothetical protein